MMATYQPLQLLASMRSTATASANPASARQQDTVEFASDGQSTHEDLFQRMNPAASAAWPAPAADAAPQTLDDAVPARASSDDWKSRQYDVLLQLVQAKGELAEGTPDAVVR